MEILEAVAAIRAVCPIIGSGRLEVPLRRASADGTRLVMTARHPGEGTALTKVVDLDTAGAFHGPTVTGEVRWTDHAGERFLCAAGPFTALRTAAMSALAAQVLADPAARRLVVFGAGAQAVAHARALAVVRPVETITLLGRDPRRAREAVDTLTVGLPGVSVCLGADPRAALRDADLVCCATTATTPLLETRWLAERVHVTAVGSHRPVASELPADLLGSGTTVVVDDIEAALAESGEVVSAVRAGIISVADLVSLPDWVGSDRGVPGGRTVFKSVGTAGYDWAVARAMVAATTPELALVGGDGS